MPYSAQIKVIHWIVIGLLLMAALPMPYAYYQILRWAVCGYAAYIAFSVHTNRQGFYFWAYCFIAILYNPIAPIYFTKPTWNIIDLVVVVVVFLGSKRLLRII